MSEKEYFIGTCNSCDLYLGEKEKRGILKTITQKPISNKESFPYLSEKSFKEEIRYKCALGEVGKDCIIPKIYELAEKGTQVGKRVDLTNIRFKV